MAQWAVTVLCAPGLAFCGTGPTFWRMYQDVVGVSSEMWGSGTRGCVHGEVVVTKPRDSALVFPLRGVPFYLAMHVSDQFRVNSPCQIQSRLLTEFQRLSLVGRCHRECHRLVAEARLAYRRSVYRRLCIWSLAVGQGVCL